MAIIRVLDKHTAELIAAGKWWSGLPPWPRS